jgi:hypothetical protein
LKEWAMEYHMMTRYRTLIPIKILMGRLKT